MRRFVRIVLLTAILMAPVMPAAAASSASLAAAVVAAPSARVTQAKPAFELDLFGGEELPEPAVEIDLFEEEERPEPTWTFKVLVPASLFLGALTVVVSFFLYFPKVVLQRYRTSE